MKKSDGFRMKALYAVSSILLGLIQRAVGIGNNLLQGDGSAIHMGNADTDGDGILDGDLVIIQKTETANKGDTVVAYVNNEATLKEYQPTQKGIELHPKNPEFDIIKIYKNDEFRIGGIVSGTRC